MDDYTYGKTYLDPEHVKGGGVTHEHVRARCRTLMMSPLGLLLPLTRCLALTPVLQVRRWKALQELQVRPFSLFPVPLMPLLAPRAL